MPMMRVHGRADLVAHGGQEGALGLGRRLGRLRARWSSLMSCHIPYQPPPAPRPRTGATNISTSTSAPSFTRSAGNEPVFAAGSLAG